MNKKMKNFKKIFAISILFILCFSVFSQTVFAEINTTYGDNTGVITNNLEETLNDDDSFLSLITQLIYIVASAAEWLIQKVFTMTTGMTTFPWADRIIFNAVPFLDINFINPSNNSLFFDKNGTTAIAEIVSNIYYTVFSMATAFLGVCVGVMALRLIFASIADEKAKYKESLMKVIMAMVLLFLSHYIISFIFMVNEKMVEVAYTILMNATDGMQIDVGNNEYIDKRDSYLWKDNNGGILDSQNIKYYKETILAPDDDDNDDNYIKYFGALKTELSNTGSSKDLAAKLRDDKYYKYTVALITGKFVNGDTTITLDNWDKYRDNELTGIYNSSKGTLKASNSDGVSNYLHRYYNLLSDIEYLANLDNSKSEEEVQKDIRSKYVGSRDWNNNKDNGVTEWEYVGNYMYTNPKRATGDGYYNRIYVTKHWPVYASTNADVANKMKEEDLANFLFNTWKKLKDLEYADKKDAELNNKQALSSMGVLFKKYAYNEDNKENKYNIIACILYTMFIIQSVMYFIAYMKRFFYILILALFAPLVIVFDFLTNVAK